MTDLPVLFVGDQPLPQEAIKWSFSPPGGPGGQHANRSNTRVTLRLDLTRARLDPVILQELRTGLGQRARGDRVEISVDESRSQWRNRRRAVERMQQLLDQSLHRPQPRVPSRPTKAAKERRRRQKQRRAEIKRLRRPPTAD